MSQVSTFYKILLGKDGLGNEINYKFVPYESGHILEQAITRGGKSNLAEGMIKEFIQLPTQIRPNIVVIDTEQEFARLRNYDHDFIILGEGGELPLVLEQARELGKQVRIQRLNVIIRITSFFDIQDRFDFLTEFIRGLLEVDQKYWLPTLFFCDEVQLYANSTLRGSSKGAFSNLTQTGLKRGILCLYLSQGVKDLFSQIRKQCINRIIGYTEDKDDCELICEELLMLPKQDWQKLRDLVRVKGSFYTRGNDICDYSMLFRSQDMGWKTHEEKYIKIPEISARGSRCTEILGASLSEIQIDEMTSLKQELAKKDRTIEQLKQNQMTPEVTIPLQKQWELKGWDDAMQVVKSTMYDMKEQYEKPKVLGMIKPKPIVYIFERMSDGRVIPMDWDKERGKKK